MSVSYTLRLPDDLKRMIDSAAKSGGVSTAQLVVDALWRYLEPATVAIISPAYPDRFSDPYPLTSKPPDIKALRDICDGKGLGSIKYHNDATDPMTIALASTPREMCPYREWFEGEQYACGLPVHSAKVKHTRGPVLS